MGSGVDGKKINPAQPDEKFRKAEFFVKISGQSCYHTFGTHRVWRIVGIVLIKNLIHYEFESCGLRQEMWRRQKTKGNASLGRYFSKIGYMADL